jgi:hypothetical protein
MLSEKVWPFSDMVFEGDTNCALMPTPPHMVEAMYDPFTREEYSPNFNFKGDYHMWNSFDPYHDNRRGISNILQCMNKWVAIQFVDGVNLQVYVTSADFNSATGFLTHQSYNSLVCNGAAIQNSQQAEACKDQWVELVLPNHISLSFYLTHFDDHVVGGSFQSNQLLGLYNRVTSVQC